MAPKFDPSTLFSGGGISFLTGSKNGRFSYGYSTYKGKRASMEDTNETRISEVNGQTVAFFGVFDGHGGSRAAEYLKNHLFNNLSNHPDFISDTKSAIAEAFKQTDVNYLKEEKGQQKDAGSTASTAVLLGDRLLVANVGDSRVVACRSGSAIPLSIDHKPDRSDERQRIENAGGFIIWAGTWRVGGVLAVSRAFGDKLLKPYVVADPEIQEEEIDGVDFLIIASDGLWNVVSNKKAPLKRMFLSDEWGNSKFAKLDVGKEVEKTITDALFWKKLEQVQKTVRPLVYVLKLVDGNAPMMAFLYDEIDKAKIEIAKAHDDIPSKYQKYWDVIDERWNSTLHSPLHAAGYFLNPKIRYRPDVSTHTEIRRGLQQAIGRFEPDMDTQLDAMSQDAVDIVQNISDAETGARKLIEEAYARGSSDNITCVVVRFNSL